MKPSSRGVGIGVAMTLVLGMFVMLGVGCGSIDANGVLGLETCDIFNCDGLFFRDVVDDHDDMAEMDSADDDHDETMEMADEHDEMDTEESEDHTHG